MEIITKLLGFMLNGVGESFSQKNCKSKTSRNGKCPIFADPDPQRRYNNLVDYVLDNVIEQRGNSVHSIARNIGIIRKRLIGPFILPNRLHAENCLNFLNDLP